MPKARAGHKVVQVTSIKMIILKKLVERRWVVVIGIVIVREVILIVGIVDPWSRMIDGH